MANLTLSQDDFLRLSKKLKNNLLLPEKNLAFYQENLAKSLGFRNLHGLNTFFSKEEIEKNLDHKRYNFFNQFKKNEFIYALQLFLPPLTDHWQMRAMSLLSCVYLIVEHLIETKQKESENYISIIKECLTLDALVKFYKQKNQFPVEIKSVLDNYFDNLPTFKKGASIQSESTLEQHGYLQSQITPMLDIFEQMEKSPILIFPFLKPINEKTKSILVQKNQLYSSKNDAYPIGSKGHDSSYMISTEYELLSAYWKPFQISGFFNNQLIEFVSNFPYEKDLFLQDIILMYVRTLNRTSFETVLKQINIFTNNLSTTMDYSENLKTFMNEYHIGK